MLVQIKKNSSDGKIPRGLLLNGSPAIRTALSEFEFFRQLDKDNEKFPKPGQSRPQPGARFRMP